MISYVNAEGVSIDETSLRDPKHRQHGSGDGPGGRSPADGDEASIVAGVVMCNARLTGEVQVVRTPSMRAIQT